MSSYILEDAFRFSQSNKLYDFPETDRIFGSSVVFHTGSRFVVEEGCRYLERNVIKFDMSFMKNAISPRFLCNSRRFLRLVEECDCSKSLKIIDDFCSPELTKYFRSLTFSGAIDYKILDNCFQLVNLKLDDCDDVQNLPRTLRRLEIFTQRNAQVLDFTYIKNLEELSIDVFTRERPKVNLNFPKLKKLIVQYFIDTIDMSLIPNLKVLEIICGHRTTFLNTETHNLEKLILKGKVSHQIYFPNLVYLETVKPIRYSHLNISELRIPVNPFDYQGCPSLKKLTFFNDPFLDDIYLSRDHVNLHDVYPKLEVLEYESLEKNHKISFNHGMQKITSMAENISENTISEYFSFIYEWSMFKKFRQDPETYSGYEVDEFFPPVHSFGIHANFLSQRGELNIYRKNQIIATVYFDNFNFRVNNFYSKLYNVSYKNCMFILREI